MIIEHVSWLSTALSGISAAFCGLLVYINKKKKNSIKETYSLSKSEAKFREDILEELDKVKDDLEGCRQNHLEAERKNLILEYKVRALEEEVSHLKAQLAETGISE